MNGVQLSVRHGLPHHFQQPRTGLAALLPGAVLLQVRLQRGVWAAGAAWSRAPAAPQAPAELTAAARLAAARRAEMLLMPRPWLPAEPSAPVSDPSSATEQGAWVDKARVLHMITDQPLVKGIQPTRVFSPGRPQHAAPSRL